MEAKERLIKYVIDKRPRMEREQLNALSIESLLVVKWQVELEEKREKLLNKTSSDRWMEVWFG